MHGEPDVPCRMAAWDALELQHLGTDAGDGDIVRWTNRSRGGDHRGERGQGGWAALVEPGTSLVPLLRSQRRSHDHGPGTQLSHRLGISPRRIPGDVWNPSFLPAVLRTNRGESAPGNAGASSRCRSVV